MGICYTVEMVHILVIVKCSHVLVYFKCPLSYCLPVWKICDNVLDCPNGEDELGCVAEQDVLCPGFLRCKGGGCVHQLQVCDGQVDCLNSQEDEYGCDNALCPKSCICLGATMSCYGDTPLDAKNYKALFRMDSTAQKHQYKLRRIIIHAEHFKE